MMATIVLVAFALAIGTITMNWGKNYVENLGEDNSVNEVISVELNPEDPQSAIKQLQLEYLSGTIDLQEYIEKEKELLRPSPKD